MNKYVLVLLTLAVGTFIFGGCASFSKARIGNLPLVHLEQTTKDLEAALGPPAERSVKGDAQTWYYDLYSDNSARTYPYKAVLHGVNGAPAVQVECAE